MVESRWPRRHRSGCSRRSARSWSPRRPRPARPGGIGCRRRASVRPVPAPAGSARGSGSTRSSPTASGPGSGCPSGAATVMRRTHVDLDAGVVRVRAVRRHDPRRARTTAARSRLSLLDLGAGCAWAVGRSGRRRPPRDAHAGWPVDRRVPGRPPDALGPRGLARRPLDGGDAEPDPRPDRRRRPRSDRPGSRSSAGARTAGRSSSSRAARSPAGSACSTWPPPRRSSSPTRRSARSSGSPTTRSSHVAHAWACPARCSRSTRTVAHR